MHIKRILSFAILLLACNALELKASDYEADNCCPSLCCDYLTPCAWSLQVQGGVNPIVWAGRNDNCCINGAQLPSYRHLFKIPWVVGGKIGYNLSECTELYIEGDYTQARGKACAGFLVTCPQSVNASATITTQLSKYKAFGVWLGARYYFGSGCLNACSCLVDRAAFFVGMQVGFAHRKQVEVSLSSVSTSGNSGPVVTNMFLKSNSVSAGGNFGIDFAVNDCFSVVFTVEVLANGAAKNCPVTCLSTPLLGLNSNTLVVGRYGTEMWFPITLGLKYNF